MKRLIAICVMASLLFGCSTLKTNDVEVEDVKQETAVASNEFIRPVFNISTYYDYNSDQQMIFSFLAERRNAFAEVTAYDSLEADAFIDKTINQFLTDNAPDIVLGRPDMPIKDLIEKGYMHDITDRVEANYSLMGDNASQTVMEALRVDGRYYGLPRTLLDYQIYFNEYLLDEIGFDYCLDYTVDEFIDVCFDLKAQNTDLYLFPEPDFNSARTRSTWLNEGGVGQVLIDQLVVSDMDYFISDNEARFNSKEFIERLSKVKTLLSPSFCKPMIEEQRNISSEQLIMRSEYIENILMLPLLTTGYGDELYYFDDARFEGMNAPFGTYTGYRLFSGDFNFISLSSQDLEGSEDMLISYIMGYRSRDGLNYLNTAKAIGIAREYSMYSFGSDPKDLIAHLNKKQLSQEGNHFLWITPPVTIIREACKDMLLNDISPEKTAETIQNKINLYLLESK